MIAESNMHSGQKRLLMGLHGTGKYSSLIREHAAAAGVSSDALLRIYGAEGAIGYVGDHGSSFGPFQLHYGGLAGGGNRFSGMGDLFTKETGLDARDPSTVGAQTDWMIRYGKTHRGYSSDIWHGLRGHGGSINEPPVHLPPQQKQSALHIHQKIYLDGKQIATNTVRHMVKSAVYPSSVGRQDGRGTWMHPGAEVFA